MERAAKEFADHLVAATKSKFVCECGRPPAFGAGGLDGSGEIHLDFGGTAANRPDLFPHWLTQCFRILTQVRI